MQLIDVGVCVNNQDPKGIGRIRYRPYGLYRSEIEKAIKYEDWDENDQFIALPFLPPHINIIPKKQQSVKMIRFDPDKPTQNVMYIWGPTGTPHDFESQEFTIQHTDTTYGGVIVADLPNLKTKDGKFIDKKSEGAVADLDHISLNGNYGSDVIFTENGLMLRGGKLINKEVTNPQFRKRLSEVPLLSEKMAKINLKKFPRTMQLFEETIKTTKVTVSKIKYIVEYTIDDLTTPTNVSLWVYKVISDYGMKFDTNTFNTSTELGTNEVKLINNKNGDPNVPTAIASIDSIKSGYIEIRELLHIIDQKGLKDLDPSYPTEDVYPFYFRPTQELLSRTTTDNQKTSRKEFTKNVHVRNNGVGSGLIFSRLSANPPLVGKPKKVKVLKPVDNGGEQAFASMTADLLYLISSNNNKGPYSNAIDFTNMDLYEYTQTDYLSEIDPKTYATVRGEVLVNLLKLMYEVLIGHVHNINEPAIYIEEKEAQLRDMINTMTKYMVNHSVRIN